MDKVKDEAPMTEAEYARKYKPFKPLPEGEKMPTMSSMWTHANRKYGRYTGYAWGGVCLVGGVGFLLGQLGGKKVDKEDVKS